MSAHFAHSPGCGAHGLELHAVPVVGGGEVSVCLTDRPGCGVHGPLPHDGASA